MLPQSRIAITAAACATVLLVPVAQAVDAAGAVAAVNVTADGLSVAPQVAYDRLVVAVDGPEGFYVRREFDAGSSPFLPFDAPLVDGTYAYEVRSVPRVDAATREAMAASRESGDEALQEQLAAVLPRGGVQSGYFTILGGSVVTEDLREPVAASQRRTRAGSAGAPSHEAPVPPAPDATVLTNADGVIRNSLCVGFDCPDAPIFDDSTTLFMENNTRLKFGDTSNAPFPSNDWEIEANSSLSGGANYLGFNDCGTADNDGGCATDLVFAVEAGARQNALYVESDGDVGIGTSLPVLDLHIVTGNTPSMRLDQDGSSGFAPQVWDIAGNEANFFVRDVTGGSKLPLRIRPGAPTSSIDINAVGNVGIGTAAPTKPLHVSRSDGTAQVLITETNAAVATRTLLNMTNNGPARMTFNNGAAASTWAVDNDASGNFVVNKIDGDGAEMTLDGSGNLTITGVYSPSDRNLKTDVVGVDRQDVLAKVAQMPISFWRFKEGSSDLHVGPMAQDFVGAFGLGPDDKRISPSDVGGVALAAIQALNDVVLAKDAQIAAQQAQIAALAERLAAVEQALAASRP